MRDYEQIQMYERLTSIVRLHAVRLQQLVAGHIGSLTDALVIRHCVVPVLGQGTEQDDKQDLQERTRDRELHFEPRSCKTPRLVVSPTPRS